MTETEQIFESILKKFSEGHSLIEEGKMMSSRAITWEGKVFAFLYRDEMGFKLGTDFDPQKWGIHTSRPLNPFKTKPPLKGWLLIDKEESKHWELLTEMALAQISSQTQKKR